MSKFIETESGFVNLDHVVYISNSAHLGSRLVTSIDTEYYSQFKIKLNDIDTMIPNYQNIESWDVFIFDEPVLEDEDSYFIDKQPVIGWIGDEESSIVAVTPDSLHDTDFLYYKDLDHVYDVKESQNIGSLKIFMENIQIKGKKKQANLLEKKDSPK